MNRARVLDTESRLLHRWRETVRKHPQTFPGHFPNFFMHSRLSLQCKGVKSKLFTSQDVFARTQMATTSRWLRTNKESIRRYSILSNPSSYRPLGLKPRILPQSPSIRTYSEKEPHMP